MVRIEEIRNQAAPAKNVVPVSGREGNSCMFVFVFRGNKHISDQNSACYGKPSIAHRYFKIVHVLQLLTVVMTTTASSALPKPAFACSMLAAPLQKISNEGLPLDTPPTTMSSIISSSKKHVVCLVVRRPG